jgi:Autoinducer binding domain
MKENTPSYQPIELNSQLQSYRDYITTTLSKASDYEDFATLIEQELARYGIVHWTYTALDLPDRLTAEAHLGFIDQDYVDTYMEYDLYKYDLVLQHVKSSDRPIFQSDIEQELNQISFSSELVSGYKKIVTKLSDFGYYDSCCIPVTSSIDGSRFVMCINSKSNNTTNFKSAATKNLQYLQILATAVNYVGIKKHPLLFLSPIKKYQSLVYSKPLALLRTLFKNDCSVKDAASHLGISVNTADNHIKKLKRDFDVRTIHGAYEFAVIRGLIE